MQKALTQMNVKLQHVIRDITGKKGMDIIEAIAGGERDHRKLAWLRDPRTKADEATIARSLQGHWRQGFMTGLRSCRKLEAVFRKKIPYLWLTGWQHPDHNTLWRFYKAHGQAIRELFKRTVRHGRGDGVG